MGKSLKLIINMDIIEIAKRYKYDGIELKKVTRVWIFELQWICGFGITRSWVLTHFYPHLKVVSEAKISLTFV